MTTEQQVAALNARVACALIEMHGMVAENAQRAIEDKSMAYTEEAFYRIIERNGLGYNTVMFEIQNQ